MSIATAPVAPPPGGRRIRAYDFSKPDTLDRNQLRSLRIPLDGFARRAGRLLSGRLRLPVRFEPVELEQRAWSDLSAEIEDPTHLALFSLNPLPGRSVLHLPLGLAMRWVDLALGGLGQGSFPQRPLTEVEQALVSGLLKVVLDELAGSLSAVTPVAATVVSEVASPVLVQLPTAQETSLVCPFAISVGEGEPLVLRIVLPLMTLRPVLPALAGEEQDDGQVSYGLTRLLTERLLDAPVDAVVRFGAVRLTSVEITSLAPGDVVPLGHEPHRPLALAVGELETALVVPGRRGRHLVCTVVEVSEEEQRP